MKAALKQTKTSPQIMKDARLMLHRKSSFDKRWEELDTTLPDTDITEEEIMDEVKAVRHARRK